ncbi:MAG: hypothetical protein AB9869_27115 [Verrucomicrobiia bacterium]
MKQSQFLKLVSIACLGGMSSLVTVLAASPPEEAPLTVPGLLFEAWYEIPGTAVNLLTQHPRYIANTPDFRALATSADTRTVFPDDSNDNYGGRLSGFLVPAVSGTYEFFLRSDSASQLYLSPDSNPANLVLIAEEIGCCEPFQEPGDPRTSAPIDVLADRPLAFQVLWKESDGPDYAQVAWRQIEDPTPAADLDPIPGEFLQVLWDLEGQPGFTTRPLGTNVSLGGALTLTAEAIGAQPIAYRWSLHGAAIEGATNSSLILTNFALTNTGIYTVEASNRVGTASAIAGVFPRGSLFVEAEDFNFDGGRFLTNQSLAGTYRGDAYRGLGTEADQGIDYRADGNGNQPYREATGADVGKENQQPDWFPRGQFNVAVNNILGWNDPGEWYSYTRQFPASTTDYQILGRLASADVPIYIQMDEVTSGATTTNQTLRPLGQFRPGRATAGSDDYEFFPLVDDAGDIVTVTNWTGLKTFRVTFPPQGAGDMDYFVFVPLDGGGPEPGTGFTSITREGNNLVLTWTTGTLESANSVTGPWTVVAGASSPASIPMTGSARFYRLR